MAVRASNTYENRALGVYKLVEVNAHDEPDFAEGGRSQREVFGKYLSWHVRRQLS